MGALIVILGLVVFLGLLVLQAALGAILGLLIEVLLRPLWMLIGGPGIWGEAVAGALLGAVLFAVTRVTPQGRLEVSPRGGFLFRRVYLSGSVRGAVIGTVLGALVWLCGGSHKPQSASMLLGALMGLCMTLTLVTRGLLQKTATEGRSAE